MSLTTLASSPLERERQALRVRVGLGVKMLTNAGYAMIGGAVFRPLLAPGGLPAAGYAWAGAGLVALVFALWFAPDGEASRD
jgi:hypothetical protein